MRGTLISTVGCTSPRLSTILSTASHNAIDAPHEMSTWSSHVWPKAWAHGKKERLRSSALKGRIPCTALMLEMRFPCERITPLGSPVVPDVYTRQAGSLDSAWRTGLGFCAPAS